MKQKLLLSFVLSLSFFMTSCETQIGNAVKHASLNLVNGNVFKHAFSGSAYEELKTKTKNEENLKLKTGPVPLCIETPSQDVLPTDIFSSLEDIKDQLCSCQAWGSCDSKSCSCDSLCPKNFEILNRPSALDDSPENSLSFINTSDDYGTPNDISYQGYCWGHAVVTQKFNRLAFFNPRQSFPYQGEDQEEERIKEYKKIIEKINNNEPVDIPGFVSLYEFSNHPEVKPLLIDKVKSVWGEHAMSIQGIKMITNSTPPNQSQYETIVNDIEERLANHQSPSIVFNQDGNATASHVTLVSKVITMPDGSKELCIRDNNFPPHRVENCQTRIKRLADGVLTYFRPDGRSYHNIGQVKIVHNEEPDVVEQVKNLQEKCATEKGCSK